MISVERCRKMYDLGTLPRCLFFFRPSEKPTEKGVFSQWFLSSFTDGIDTFSSAEQYMMSQKAYIFGDMDMYNKIMHEHNPAKLKKYGRLVRNFDENIWNKEKYMIVLNGNIMKFSNPLMKQVLLSTGDAILVEASPYDDVWGIKLAENSPLIDNPYNWRGQNLLGRALMETRNIFRLQEQSNNSYISIKME